MFGKIEETSDLCLVFINLIRTPSPILKSFKSQHNSSKMQRKIWKTPKKMQTNHKKINESFKFRLTFDFLNRKIFSRSI
jgi:hypothetical protein